MGSDGLRKAALPSLRRLRLCGVTGWRRRVVVVALATLAVLAAFITFATPFSLFSCLDLTIGGEFGAPMPLSPPLILICSPNCSDSRVAISVAPVVAPAQSPVDFEDLEVDYSNSSDSKAAPLWAEDSEAKAVPLWTEPASTSESPKFSNPRNNFDKFDGPSLSLQKTVVLTATDKQLIHVKRDIERAPIVFDDPELYAPIFKNVSIFKRSYELMENILKVYIYEEGKRPIFHKPELKGIYASEGWFMKLMRENKKYIVKDPSKAHLFYLPYSVRRLEQALFLPNSHNMVDLMIFLRDYINMISVKYPFWNRTHGADHFLVACHDWGPYTTKKHDELRTNTIKALCNADVSEGIFARGRDVSLPETTIRSPRRPMRDVGGKPVSQRTILAFFAGQMHGRVRPTLIQYWRGRDEDMKIYGPIPKEVTKKMSYIQHMKSSKFCICPMGYEVNSPRIVEAIYYECVPVIIADNFVLPFEEVLDWSAFSVVVAEKDITNLKDILLRISQKQYATMQMNVKRVKNHFLWHPKPSCSWKVKHSFQISGEVTSSCFDIFGYSLF